MGTIKLDVLSAALGQAVAERRPESATGRAYPSAGALYPVDVYLLSVNVATLESGVYHYRPDRHDLTLLFPEDDLADVVKRMHGQDIGDPPLMFAFAASLQRSSHKYGARSYRFALLEMGACAFALDLALGAAGLRTRWIGGFVDARLAQLLGISVDQELELPTLLLAAG
jgi:SagB-type dehydrogenase family enzyme